MARKWLGSGSEVARGWLGGGSEVARKWLGSGSEVARGGSGAGSGPVLSKTMEFLINIVKACENCNISENFNENYEIARPLGPNVFLRHLRTFSTRKSSKP